MESTPTEYKLVETDKIPTVSEVKQLRRQFFTVRHSYIQECGHSFSGEPKNNCEWCWFAYFNQYGEMTQTAEKIFQDEGVNVLEGLRGKKFVKMFKRFMGTLAAWKQQQEMNGESRSSDSSAIGQV